MAIALASYATENFRPHQRRLVYDARRFGIEKIYEYQRKDLVSTDFYQRNRKILDQPRGAGYWLWHSYFVRETLKELNDEDVLVYCDAGLELYRPLDELIEECTGHEITVFECEDYYNYQYTKRDCFVLMGCDSKEYWNGKQCLGGLNIWRPTARTFEFLEEKLSYEVQEAILTDLPNTHGLPDPEGFIDHRHNQSVLSLMAIKYNLHKLPWGRAREFLNFKNDQDKSRLEEFRVKEEPGIIRRLRNMVGLGGNGR